MRLLLFLIRRLLSQGPLHRRKRAPGRGGMATGLLEVPLDICIRLVILSLEPIQEVWIQEQ